MNEDQKAGWRYVWEFGRSMLLVIGLFGLFLLLGLLLSRFMNPSTAAMITAIVAAVSVNGFLALQLYRQGVKYARDDRRRQQEERKRREEHEARMKELEMR